MSPARCEVLMGADGKGVVGARRYRILVTDEDVLADMSERIYEIAEDDLPVDECVWLCDKALQRLQGLIKRGLGPPVWDG